MFLSAVFEFPSGPSANRFLNDVNVNPDLPGATAAWFDATKVKVKYEQQTGKYDNTLSILDDLSLHYGGKEVDI